MWHLEFENIVVLKNNKGTEFNRVRQLDYCFQINKTLYQRLIDGKDITFFSPHDVPDLYDAFCADQEEFERLYIKYELDETIRRKTMPAIEAFSHLIQERAETGRIYIQNIDNANEHGSFIPEIAPIEQSNLCCVTGETLVTVLLDNNQMQLPIIEILDLIESGKNIKAMSYNTETDTYSFEKITNAIKTKSVTEYYEIEDEKGNILRCTEDHLIYTKNRGYVRADELQEDDEIISL